MDENDWFALTIILGMLSAYLAYKQYTTKPPECPPCPAPPPGPACKYFVSDYIDYSHPAIPLLFSPDISDPSMRDLCLKTISAALGIDPAELSAFTTLELKFMVLSELKISRCGIVNMLSKAQQGYQTLEEAYQQVDTTKKISQQFFVMNPTVFAALTKPTKVLLILSTMR
jgi:hypothetical protein